MTVYEVSYDLNGPASDYDDLHEAIEELGDSLHALESYWLVEANSTSTSEIRENLQSNISGDDQLVVTKMPNSGGGRWSVSNASHVHEWLDDRL